VFRKGKAFSERPFALHRQQFENHQQNIDVAPLEKVLPKPMCASKGPSMPPTISQKQRH